MVQSATRILVVDDAALVRLYYRKILEDVGYELAEALNGVEALEKLLTQSAHLLIVDVNMPQMDGLAFLRTLRRQEMPLAAIPAIVISTESRPQDFAAAREVGANFYMPKPVRQEALLEAVALMVGTGAAS